MLLIGDGYADVIVGARLFDHIEAAFVMSSPCRWWIERLAVAFASLHVLVFADALAQETAGAVETANPPASEYCLQQGGSLLIETGSDGGQRRICVLGDNRRCEEWALYSGECLVDREIEDPFAYCAANTDRRIIPLAETGGEFPVVLLPSMLEQGIVSAEMPPALQGATHWRCMDGHVWVCPVGANLPCSEKADLAKTPSRSMVAYCQANPDADAIPAIVTGRATVYAWKCAGATPLIVRQVFSADAEGYLSEFWHQLEPLPTPEERP